MTATDRDEVISIHKRSIYGLCKDHYTEAEMKAWTDFLTPALFDAGLRDPNIAGMVAVDGDEIAGFGFINTEAGDLRGLYVHPRHIGMGVGSLLVKRLEKAASEKGVGRLSLKSTRNATGFYAKLGYRELGAETQQLHDGIAIPCVRMEKELRP